MSVIDEDEKLVDHRRKDVTTEIYKKRFNIKENDSLSSLRDTLLPKLMSGELNVNTITE